MIDDPSPGQPAPFTVPVAPTPTPATRASAAPALVSYEERARADYADDAGLRAEGVVGVLLMHPGWLVRRLAATNHAGPWAAMCVVGCAGLVLYGALMGSYSGGEQLWIVPTKLLVMVWASLAICAPSYYIFGCLAGVEQSWRGTALSIVVMLALTSVLLVGLAPVVWLFSSSTGSLALMGTLHFAAWGTGLYFGLRLLRIAAALQADNGRDVTTVWRVLFVLVLLQMSTVLRPLLGEHAPLALGEKRFFALYYFDALHK